MELITKYFPEINDEQKQKFSLLFPLYRDWNAKINVISRKDIDNFNLHHLLHSLAVAKFIKFKANTKILDCGTGGGLPGIPLAILFPECSFTLVDSVQKKIKVADAIVKELGLTNVSCVADRVENIQGKFHFIVSRAVAELKMLVSWTQKKISNEQFNPLPNGLIALKGGNISGEIQPYKKRATVVDISQWFDEEYFFEKRIVYIPL